MTKKHFVAIATDLRAQLGRAETLREAEIVAQISRNLAHQFAQINRNFNYRTFYIACGLDVNGHVGAVVLS